MMNSPRGSYNADFIIYKDDLETVLNFCELCKYTVLFIDIV